MVVVKTEGAVSQNEICHVEAGGSVRLMAEVIKVIGDEAYIQVFDSTRGLRVGAPVEFAGHMLEATLAYRFGESAYSALAWWDAPTPYADYYRDMPGWWGHSEAMRRRLTQLWRDRDPSVVQLDWRAIVAGNDKDRPDEAIVLEDRVERVSEMQAAFAARTALGARSYVLYGVRYRNENTSYFKRMKDRLGSASAEDIDQYLVDDGTAHNSMAHNDIRQRGRLIDEGDKFGYNYEMRASTTSAFVMASHSGRRYEVAAQVELASSSIQRHGRYEKEIYPGKLSYGPSRKFEFAVGSVKLAGRYSFSPRHIVTLAGDIGTSAPRYGSIFLSPDYSNRAIRAPKVEKLISGEAGYTFVAGSLRLELAGYITRASDQTAIYRYYDDIQSAYSEMVLSGVDKSYMGLEFGGRWDITAKFSLNVAAAIGRYVYASYPKVELFEDRTLELYSNLNVKSAPDTTFLKNYHLGGSPEMALSAEFSYNNRGWLISLTGNVMGGRYVEPNPLRRMARVYEETKTRHNLNLMVDQLDPAFTFDLFVMKSFMMTDRVRLTLMLTVDNLLNDRNIKYNGYEPMRIHETEESNRVYYTTHASRYLYSYGRSWYASAIFRF